MLNFYGPQSNILLFEIPNFFLVHPVRTGSSTEAVSSSRGVLSASPVQDGVSRYCRELDTRMDPSSSGDMDVVYLHSIYLFIYPYRWWSAQCSISCLFSSCTSHILNTASRSSGRQAESRSSAHNPASGGAGGYNNVMHSTNMLPTKHSLGSGVTSIMCSW